ncbi:MAG: addiction module protein [Thermoanaerobaculia bacterium]
MNILSSAILDSRSLSGFDGADSVSCGKMGKEAESMSRTVQQIKTRLEQLSQNDRAELAHFLLESIGPSDAGAATAWEEELGRRVTEIREGRDEGRAAEKVFADLRKGDAGNSGESLNLHSAR